jgi:hypothetical protein
MWRKLASPAPRAKTCCGLTIVGAGRERLVAVLRWKTVCARSADLAASCGRSTLPLETHAWERISGKNPSVQIRGESAATARSSCSRLRLTLRGACGNQPSHRLSILGFGTQLRLSLNFFALRRGRAPMRLRARQTRERARAARHILVRHRTTSRA